MDGDNEHAEEFQNIICALLRSYSHWFNGQARQWAHVEDEEGHEVVKCSAGKLLSIMKARANMFSRTDRFVGCPCITGPPGGDQGIVLYACRMFGGDGRLHLCHNMGPIIPLMMKCAVPRSAIVYGHRVLAQLSYIQRTIRTIRRTLSHINH